MKVSKLKLIIFLIILALIAVGIWFFVFQKSDQKSNSDNSQSSGQINAPAACEVFGDEDAANIFGSDISTVPLSENGGGYTSPTDIAEAPNTESKSSHCIYIRGEISTAKPNEEEAGSGSPSIQPAPEGNKEVVDSSDSIDEIKKSNPKPVPIPEVLADITLRATTIENAKSDFNRAKNKSAEEVNGLGDSAFSLRLVGLSGKKQFTLTVLKGEHIITIAGDNLNLETAKEISNVILGNL